MKKVLVATLLLLAAQSGWAGVEYEFSQSTQSDIEQLPPTHLNGRAIIEGTQSRVDFVGGNIYAPGAYVITTTGSRTMLFVDPVSKSYSEINAAALAASLGGSNVTVSTPKINVKLLPDQPVIAGVPTTHYQLTITYDLTLYLGSMPLKQAIREETEKWTTHQFGDVSGSFLNGGTIKTGNVELDKIIEAETTAVSGFPLRQKTTITTTNLRGKVPGSKLELSSVRTQTRDFQIQSIKQTKADGRIFAIPSTFQKVDGSQQANLTKASQVTVLNFEGEKKP